MSCAGKLKYKSQVEAGVSGEPWFLVVVELILTIRKVIDNIIITDNDNNDKDFH